MSRVLTLCADMSVYHHYSVRGKVKLSIKFNTRFVPLRIADGAVAEEDCERPPSIANGQSTLSVDGNEDIVSAKYSCDPGYELRGEAEIFCDLDTETWQGKAPACHKGKKDKGKRKSYAFQSVQRAFITISRMKHQS